MSAQARDAALDRIYQAAQQSGVTIAPLTHVVSFEATRSGQHVAAACGAWIHIDDDDITRAVTCPACLADEAQTSEDVFGEAPVGTPVHHKPFNPLAGYRLKGAR